MPAVPGFVKTPLARLILSLSLFFVLNLLITTLLSLSGIPSPSLLTNFVAALASIVAMLVVIKFVERQPLSVSGLGPSGAARSLGLGIVFGVSLFSAVIGILALAGYYRVTAVAGERALELLLVGIITFFFVAVFEEVLFRGILFRILEQGVGSWLALLISALFFGFSHLLNPTDTILAALAVTCESGILLAAVYMLTRNLWAPIGIHWAWNFCETNLYGASPADSPNNSLLVATINGPSLLTGGTGGPAIGIIAILLCLISSLVVFYVVVRNGEVVTPRWFLKRNR